MTVHMGLPYPHMSAIALIPAPKTLPRSGLSVPRRELVNYCGACLGDHFILRIGTSRTTDRADNLAMLDQRNTASRRNDSIEREQIVEMNKMDTALEDFCFAPEGRGCSRLVLRYLNRGEHGVVHSLEGNQIATGIGYRNVHLPI